MALHSPTLATMPSTFTSIGQIVILVASDGVRVPVNRAIATEASFVLRDMLDGEDLLPTVHHDRDLPGVGSISAERPPATVSKTKGDSAVTQLENLFEVADITTPATSGGALWSPHPQQQEGGDMKTEVAAADTKTVVPDLMDFFSVAPASHPPADVVAERPSSVEATPLSNAFPTFSGDTACPVGATPTAQVQPLAQTTPSLSCPSLPRMLPPTEVEVPFPYFTGDILERVCRHMSYRFRMSSFGSEDGCYRVYAVKSRPIPRPMTLPLVEYLDTKDRAFIADWDELITVQMVKAATLLNYEELLQLASAKLGSYLIERDLEGVRTLLGVKGDFDPSEDAELKKEQAMDYLR